MQGLHFPDAPVEGLGQLVEQPRLRAAPGTVGDTESRDERRRLDLECRIGRHSIGDPRERLAIERIHHGIAGQQLAREYIAPRGKLGSDVKSRELSANSAEGSGAR
ncbi:unnamed protein product, partial [marine sediment metagenome]